MFLFGVSISEPQKILLEISQKQKCLPNQLSQYQPGKFSEILAKMQKLNVALNYTNRFAET
jgi:hypothetical protein